LFRWNDRVRNLFIDWGRRQLEYGLVEDDQYPLCEALSCSAKALGVKYGQISPNWALAWLSLNKGKDGEWFRHRTSQIVQGAPQICHSRDICIQANRTSWEERVLYRDVLSKNSPQAFFSQEEIDRSGILP